MLNCLNFRHLYHFWIVAREGSMAAASRVLELMPRTLSSQVAALTGRLRHGFPQSLQGQPFLVNAVDAPYVSELMQWCNDQNIRVSVRAQVDDSALIKVFGHHGMGVFAAPAVIEDEVCRQYEVESLAEISSVQDRLFAITRGSRIFHPAVEAICAGGVNVHQIKSDKRDE